MHHYIRSWRKHRGLTLKQLAERLESEPGEELISYASLSRIERGSQPYSQPILEAIATALDVLPAELLQVDPSQEGDVVDVVHMMQRADDDKRGMVMAMIRAALAS